MDGDDELATFASECCDDDERSIRWPHWVSEPGCVRLAAILRLAIECKRESPGRHTAIRDAVRALGFSDRNSVGVLADLMEKQLNQSA